MVLALISAFSTLWVGGLALGGLIGGGIGGAVHALQIAPEAKPLAFLALVTFLHILLNRSYAQRKKEGSGEK